MDDVDVIEAINFEQLVTETDRLLLRRGRPSKRRFGIPSLERTMIVQRPQRDAIDLTVVLGSAIVTTLLFIAILA